VTIFPDRENKDITRLDSILPAVSVGYTRTPKLDNLTIADIRKEFSRYGPLTLGIKRPEEIQYE
jgi:hypothetical protein